MILKLLLLNWPHHSCRCGRSPLYCDSLRSGSGSFFLLVIASANCFIKYLEPRNGADYVGFFGPPQLSGFGTVAPYKGGTMEVTKIGAVLEEELNVSVCIESDVTWVWYDTAACTWMEERIHVGTWGLLNGASVTLFKFTDVPTSGIELAGTNAGKRQTSRLYPAEG